jgi:hypothetical protein
MMTRGTAYLPALLMLLMSPAAAHPQTWAVDLYAGRTRHEQSGPAIDATSLVGSIRHYGGGGWFYAAVAAPVDEGGPTWGTLGGSLRFPAQLSSTASSGLRLGGQGYAYRDALLRSSGHGATLDASLFLLAEGERLRVEVSGGPVQHFAAVSGESASRSALQGSVRAESLGPVRVGAGARLVRVSEGSYPAVSADVTTVTGRLTLAGSAERWLGSDVSDFGWAASAGFDLRFIDVWGAVRRETREPLYWNTIRTTWSTGISRRLGVRIRERSSGVIAAPPRLRSDRAAPTRIRITDPPSGPVHIAGDFTGWQIRPMTRRGSAWEIDLPLEPGVYSYAFVDARGRWFVPEGTPGRRDDGMGGHVAVLVVP